jgi:hypothetical protein
MGVFEEGFGFLKRSREPEKVALESFKKKKAQIIIGGVIAAIGALAIIAAPILRTIAAAKACWGLLLAAQICAIAGFVALLGGVILAGCMFLKGLSEVKNESVAAMAAGGARGRVSSPEARGRIPGGMREGSVPLFGSDSSSC